MKNRFFTLKFVLAPKFAGIGRMEIFMITELATKAIIEKWKRLFNLYAPSMLPNRKTGEELDNYFRSKYEYQTVESKRWEYVVKANLMENECFYEKIPQGAAPIIKSYSVEGVMVGIDIVSGYFQVESEKIEKAVPIYDDLFVYRGLDATDLKNIALVGQYLGNSSADTGASASISEDVMRSCAHFCS